MIANHALAILVSLSPAVASEPPSPSAVRGTILRATRAYERQDYDDAIQIYATIPPTPDRPAPICFNEGLAFAGLEDRGRAAQSFRMADLNAEDPKIRADARFNLARLRYDSAIELVETEPQQAMEELRDVARTFRSVLDIDPNDVEAARNVERTRLTIRQIKDLLERQAEEQRQRQSQLNDMAQQLQQLAERQRQAADQSAQAEEQRQQDSSIGAEASRQSQANQKPISEETRDLMEQLLNTLQNTQDSESGQTEMSEALSQMSEARQEQGQAERQLSESKPGQAEGDQRDAAELLQQAAERLAEAAGKGQEGQQPGEQEGQRGGRPGDGENEDQNEQDQPSLAPPREVRELGRADGDPIARKLLEKEILDRANRIRRGPPIPAERDW